MTEPTPPRATARETLVFFAKLAAYLAGLFAFGLVIFWLRRSIHR